jgi:hypothetical protein
MNKYINAEFVNTSEAYSQIAFFGNNSIAIPYINIGLMPDNPITHRQSFVDYSYYILNGVKSMEYGSAKGKLLFGFNLLIDEEPLIIEYIGLGNYKSVDAEVKVDCQALHYYTFGTSKISMLPDDFIPYETLNFKQTLNTDEVEKFFSFQNIPNEIKTILGNNINSIVWK